MGTWTPRVEWPEGLVTPVGVGTQGGPTPARARGRLWERTSAGLYVPAGIDRSSVEQRIVEQAARLPGTGAVTGWAALRMAGAAFLDGLAPDGRTRLPVPLAVPHSFRLAPTPALTLLRASYDAHDVDELHGIRVMRPVRALFDEVRRVGELREAVVAMDMALVAALVSFAQIDELIESQPQRRGMGLFRAARRLATSRSASPMETRMRLVWVLDAGLPEPRCNWPVADEDGRYLGRPDLLCDGLGVFGEFDGRHHRLRERHRQDVGRSETFLGVGLEGFVVVGADLHDRSLVVRRMRAAVARAEASSRPRTWLLRPDPKPLWP